MRSPCRCLTILVAGYLLFFCPAAHAANGGAAIAVTAGSVTRFPLAVVPQPDSGAIVVYAGVQLSQVELRAQRVDRRGRPQWGNGLFLGGNDLNNGFGSCISDGAGGFLYAYSETRGATGQDVIVQRVLPNGTFAYGPTGLVVCNATRDQTGPQLMLGPGSTFYVVWSDDRPALSNLTDFYAQRVTLAGDLVDFCATGDGVDFDDRFGRIAPRLAEAAHLRSFRAEYGKMARAGLLLHTGNTLEWLASDILAAPWWSVL